MRPIERPEGEPTGEAAMPQVQHLFPAIVAQAASVKDRALTVADIAQRLDTPPKAVAACIALHLAASGNVGDPRKLIVPRPEDPVSDDMLGIVRL
jgi:hypothetical protein